MSIVVSLNDPAYAESKAMELIAEAKQTTADSAQYQEKLSQALSLLALAKVQRRGTTTETATKEGT